MQLSLKKDELIEYVCRQLNTFYPDNKMAKKTDINIPMDLTLDRVQYCFSHIKLSSYNNNGCTLFNHLHSDQYSQFLYYLSNSIYKLDYDTRISDKLICLNKALHGIWYSYKGKMPDIFLLDHPVGTVLGNAAYSDYLYVCQNVTVNTGSNPHEKPILGKELVLFAGSKIIGDGTIGDCVTLGVNATVYKQDISSNSLVYNDYNGAQKIKKYKSIAREFFYID